MATIQEINSNIMYGDFTNDQLDSIITAIKFARNQITRKNMTALTIGTEVKFTSRTGQTVLGTVLQKVDRKFVIVKENNRDATWRVPAYMLQAA